MIVEGTPVEWSDDDALWVKREDQSCPPPGPPFSKTRGVFAHIAARNERVIGVLDTLHSQAGHAVAAACKLLGRECVNYYPVFKREGANPPLRPAQEAAYRLGAATVGLPAGRSAILFYRARRMLFEDRLRLGETEPSVYMMPNALKLPEMVSETVAEVLRTDIPESVSSVIVAASSATIAGGVIRGLQAKGWTGTVYIHMGYSRSHEALMAHVLSFPDQLELNPHQIKLVLVDEGYSYSDKAKPGPTPYWPCNQYYDLKAYRWYMANGRELGINRGNALLWNIG